MGLNIFQSTLVWVIIGGWLLSRYRKPLARFFLHIPLPRWLLFIAVGFFFSMLEESVNCPKEGCAIIPVTWWVFLMYLLIHLAILKAFRVQSYRKGILIFGAIGWLGEFFLGADKAVLWSAPWIGIVMTVWVLATYAIIVIVPVTIYLRQEASS